MSRAENPTLLNEEAARAKGGRPIASSASDAVNALERRICGSGAVRSVPEAEGVALTGRRAATLLDARDPLSAGSVDPTVARPWVHHRIRPNQPAPAGRTAFELVAADAQEAVDHCLVARRLAVRHGRPAVSTVDRAVAERVEVLYLPDDSTIDEALAGPAVASAEPVDAVESARDAFSVVERATGRSCSPLLAEAVEGARFVAIGAGNAGAAAIESARRLRDAGIACGAIRIALVRPFPSGELARLLRGATAVSVVEFPCTAEDGASLADDVRAALAGESGPVVGRVEPTADLAADLARAFGIGDVSFDSEPDGSTPPARVNLGVVPAGAWGEALLLDAAAALGSLGPVRLRREPVKFPGCSVLEVHRGAVGDERPDTIDVLLAADPSALDACRGVESISHGGTLLLVSEANSPDEVWAKLSLEQRHSIARKKIRLSWLGFAELASNGAATPERLQTHLLGALLASDASAGAVVGIRDGLVDALAVRHPDDADALHGGATALTPVQTAEPEVDAASDELDFVERASSLRMPASRPSESAQGWRDTLRHFHLTGVRGPLSTDPLPVLPLRPLSRFGLGGAGRAWKDWPLLLCPNAETTSISVMIERAVAELAERGSAMRILRDAAPRFARAAQRALDETGGLGAMKPVLERAFELVAAEYDLTDAGARELFEELDRIEARLPEAGTVLGLDERALFVLYHDLGAESHGTHREVFRREVASLVARLEELLELDASRSVDGRAPERLASDLGGTSSNWVDVGALSGILPDPRGSKPMEPARRERIETSLATLGSYLERSESEPASVIVHPRLLPAGAVPASVRLIEHPDGLAVAPGLFDGLAEGKVDLFRAVRVARLETRNEYDSEAHDAVLARFGSQSFSADELALVPTVTVLETARRVERSLLGSFSGLLRSGRPVRVVVLNETSAGPAAEQSAFLSQYHPGIGYLAVAHREAFVLQSSLGRPSHLTAGLRRLGGLLRPAVVVVAVPSWTSPVSPWLQLAAAHEGRATPCFRYDADQGETWAERFDLLENPHRETAWPVHPQQFLDADGVDQVRRVAFTFADAASFDPGFRAHFLVVPPEAWSDDQVEVAAYIEMPAAERRRVIPYVWIVRDDDVLGRAVVTRELAFAARDRSRAWRVLQELGGTANEHARRAAVKARETARAEASTEVEKLETEHAEEIERVRSGAAGEALERLARVLTDPEGLIAAAPPVAAPAPVPAAGASAGETPAPPAPQVEEQAEEDEDLVAIEDPYIDSMLCTTCNDCININAQMFAYNDNKQATIKDAAAGTFEQLVKAAEKCPARCIHPGAPRDGDATATDALIDRAAKFN